MQRDPAADESSRLGRSNPAGVLPCPAPRCSSGKRCPVPNSMACKCHRYSSVTCPNRRSTRLSLNFPISKSLVRLYATAPAWPNTFQNACARCIAAAGLGQSAASPAVIAPSMKSKANATKEMISATGFHRCADDHTGYCASRDVTSGFRPWQHDWIEKPLVPRHPNYPATCLANYDSGPCFLFGVFLISRRKRQLRRW